MNRHTRSGVALLTALALLVVVGGISALMFARTLAEVQHSGDDSGIVQSLLLARGAANLGGAVLQGPVRDELESIVRNTSSTASRWSYGTGSGASPEASTVVTALNGGGASSVAVRLQDAIDDLLCGATPPALDAGQALALRIHVTDTACGVALPAGTRLAAARFVRGLPRDGSGSANDQTYALPFVIVAEGTAGPYRRNLVTTGEYQFTVGRGSFAQYALFTNVHRAGPQWNAPEIWFTENTLFDGPVHTNQNFRFYRNPWFGGEVTSAGCSNPGLNGCSSGAGNSGAVFYDEGFRSVAQMQPPTAPSYSNAYGTHAPELAAGVDWSAEFVPLPANSQSQRDAAEAGGLAFDDDLISLTLSATDAAMNAVPADGSVDAVYQRIEACRQVRISNNNRIRCDQYRYGPNFQLESRVLFYNTGSSTPRDSGNPTSVFTWSAMNREFNGVIHTTEDVDRLTGPGRSSANDPATASPALASFAQITVAAEGDIRITGDLTYERVPCTGTPVRVGGSVQAATCGDLAAQNILGIYSQDGDVGIGHDNSDDTIRPWRGTLSAPRNVTVHGVLMSSTGIVGVENYDSGGARGSVNLIGGIIEYYYGAFGTFNSQTGSMSTGYSRAFTYDQRTAAGLAPPYFPTIGQDGVKSVAAFSFGQREQVE
jgi:hypothetical protein